MYDDIILSSKAIKKLLVEILKENDLDVLKICKMSGLRYHAFKRWINSYVDDGDVPTMGLSREGIFNLLELLGINIKFYVDRTALTKEFIEDNKAKLKHFEYSDKNYKLKNYFENKSNRPKWIRKIK